MGRFIKTVLRIVESLILYAFFGLVPVMAIFMATVLLAAIVFGKETLGPWILWSFLPGAIIDVIFIKKWVKGAYLINGKILVVTYLFYTVCLLGFCMGIPILNFVLGVFAGVYAARKAYLMELDDEVRRKSFRKVSLFTAAAMILVCCLMTLLAIVGNMIGYRFETPILSFTFTAPVFWAIVFTGGAFLVLLQYVLTSAAAKVVFKLHHVSKT